jgi:hypothetical protein
VGVRCGSGSGRSPSSPALSTLSTLVAGLLNVKTVSNGKPVVALSGDG